MLVKLVKGFKERHIFDSLKRRNGLGTEDEAYL